MLEDYTKIFIKNQDTGNTVYTETGRDTNRNLEGTQILDYSGVSVSKNFKDPYFVFSDINNGELPSALSVRSDTHPRLIDVKDYRLLQTLVWTTDSDAQSVFLCIVPFLPATEAKTSWKPAGIITSEDTSFIVQKGMDYWDENVMPQYYPDTNNPTTKYYISMIKTHNFICDVSAFEKVGIFLGSSSSFTTVAKILLGYNLL